MSCSRPNLESICTWVYHGSGRPPHTLVRRHHVSTDGAAMALAFDDARANPEQSRGMRFSVIVCAHNEAQFLPACLHSLLAQSRTPDEILVINNASTDSTRAVAEAIQGVRVVDASRSERFSTAATSPSDARRSSAPAGSIPRLSFMAKTPTSVAGCLRSVVCRSSTTAI